MDPQTEALNRVLRCQLSAVHQQFIHVLALRAWKESETADRIMAVDEVDFPNAMRIIDFLIQAGLQPALAPDGFAPGADMRGILLAERTMEARLREALARAGGVADGARALIAAAEVPRAAYDTWLEARLATLGDGETAPVPSNGRETADLVAHLAAMIEQAMVHAFVHWHACDRVGGDRAGADAAWAASGAAMMQLTKLAQLFAADRRVPGPGELLEPQIAATPAAAHALDRALAERCAEAAAAAQAHAPEPAIAKACSRFAEAWNAVTRWTPGEPHPAAAANPPAFSSFKATWKRFVLID